MIRSSFAGFTTAQLGMSAAQASLNVAGQNISNINTKGYTRQRTDLSSFNATTGPRQWGGVNDTFIGNGVVINQIEQVRDPYLDLRFRTEMSSVGYYDKTLAALEDLQSVLDEVDKEGSIHNQLEAVFKALNEFNPQAANNEFQNMAKTEMQLLTQYFNNYSNRIQQAKEDNLTQFKDQTIPSVNQLLKDITNLNKSIKENEILGNPALELRDERNLLLDELSDYMKIEVTYEDKYLGLSSSTAQECTVKLLGVDDEGKPFKYTLIDHDKAVQLQINDDCSHLTMTDVNGNPIADIGSALKPNAAGTFTDTEAKAITDLLTPTYNFEGNPKPTVLEICDAIKDGTITSIPDLCTALKTVRKGIDDKNNEINSIQANIASLSKRGNDLHDELKDMLRLAKSNQNALDRLKEQADKIQDKDSEDYKNLEKEIQRKENVIKIYNQKLYGTDTAVDPTTLDGTDGNGGKGEGIYNKLIQIFGPITDATTHPPTYKTDADGKAVEGDIVDKKAELIQARADLETITNAYKEASDKLDAAINGTKNPDGTTKDKGLADYANITVEYESYPIEGTKSFILLPNITLAGTSSRDGFGIPLYDAETNKSGKIEVAPDPNDPTKNVITITDIRDVTYTEDPANVDGCPYEKLAPPDGKPWLDADGNPILGADGNPIYVKVDELGKPVLDMTEQTNMYDCMQEDSGSIKASLDMFNRAGEFSGDTDRGYDYYLNMLDVFARQIAKVFNEANMKDNDGNPLLDSNGKPITYANALFGADGEVPTKYTPIDDASGEYYDYTTGNTTKTPLPDVFKTNADGELLGADGKVITDNGKALTIKDVNAADTTSDIMEKVQLDENALAAYGIVKNNGKVFTNADGTTEVKIEYEDDSGNTVFPGDWVDKDGNLVLAADGKRINGETPGTAPTTSTITPEGKAAILNKIKDGAEGKAGGYTPLEGKVPKIDYDKITADNFTITKDWAEAKTNFVQTNDPSQTAGYNDNINHLISQFSQKLDYTFTKPDGTQQKIFNGTFVEFYDNMGNQLGLDIRSSTVLATNYITIANDIANNRDAVSGVSLDEEGIDILKYQKAYTASARLMTALDEALDKVINSMGIVGR